MMITTGKIDGGNTEFRRDNRYVREGTLRSLETFAGDVSLKVGISAGIVNGVIFAFAVNFDEKFKIIEFDG